jgi:guanylate cyclase
VARIALAMREALDTIRQESGEEWISVRIGIDSGPAVAGVIGRRKFIYDLWGDTVNTASRMESHGVPGEIQITDRVAAALGAGFVTRQRGTIDVKGKGRMRTYFLDATSPAPSPDGLPARVKEGGQGQLQEEHAREGQPHSPEPA